MEYVIETFSLAKTFSDWWGRNQVCAVDNLNLKIKKNEVFGLLGPNGSGKTTAIKMILGLLYPTKGRVVVFGGDSTQPKINARIGFLPEESYLYRYLTARETLDFYGRLFSLPAKVRKSRIEALLDMVGLRGAANRAVGTFSKGMARRIGLAQALINDPDLLILDEPTTGLDPIGTRQIKDLILTLARRGKTILLSSHLLADVEDVCDRIAILYGGKIQTEGSVRQLLQMADKTQITTGRLSAGLIEKIRHLIQNENSECVVDTPMDRLETFFIRTVAAAQQKDVTTSGAVSTTRIGDFLAAGEQGGKAEVIERLVGGQDFAKQSAAVKTSEPVKTQEVQQFDEKVLKDLTKPVEPAEPKPVEKPEKTTQQPQRTEEADKSILEQLIRGSQEKKEPDKQQGE
jgi:ABC-2 type transport system ATP-binding protein